MASLLLVTTGVESSDKTSSWVVHGVSSGIVDSTMFDLYLLSFIVFFKQEYECFSSESKEEELSSKELLIWSDSL